ncbi:TRAP transporter substrate-binding protein DctP [Bacillus sp. B15-48]|uniref:TRAP transporter substrate-binding protein DctP n=1 Tax=Bacillus sp. B15-48 TaxID=1548601 RepID=UPI00193F2C8E|nr:TRAP transporter substrate-binding protein DctP [Bacillus sp. B15-48]MBM4760962.1 C4-dicarboxylate ABC transporter substrate-binding protein [Bacillus sp. B15-48]
MKKYFKGLVVVFFVLVLAACGGESAGSNSDGDGGNSSSADAIKLSYAFFSPEKTYPGVVAQTWSNEIKERTDGKVDVDIYFSGTLLDAGNMLDGVANNTADIGIVALSYEPGRFPLEEIAEITRGYSTAEVASQVMDTLLQEYPSEVLDQYEIIKVFTTDAMAIHSTKPIDSLDALKGEQIRIGGALTPVLERLGGAPVGMSNAEQAQALQTGIISGYVSDRGNLKDVGFAELVGYVTDYPLAITTLVAVMNKNKYETLPEDVKAEIQALKVEMPVIAGQYLDNHIEGVLEWSKEEHGVEIVSLKDGEKDKWDAKIQELQDEYVQKAKEKGLPAEEYLGRVHELLEEYSAK